MVMFSAPYEATMLPVQLTFAVSPLVESVVHTRSFSVTATDLKLSSVLSASVS